MNSRSTFRRLLWITGFLVLTLATTFTGRSVAAQETSMSNASMDCATLLNIGGEGDACVSNVHASPDALLVDIYVDGERVLSGLGFGWWSGWVALPAGEHRVQVTAHGDAPDSAVIDAALELDAGMAYQIAATGFLAEITPQVFASDVSSPGADTARVRVVHSVPEAPAVDIAVTGGDVILSGLEFPNASESLDVPAGTYDLEVRAAGTTDVALPLPGVTIEAGVAYDIFTIGQLADGSLSVLVIPSATASGE